jgi:putative ABC transport system permease protein
MKAVGAKNSHIMVLFLIESGILGMVGGVIGIVLGLSLSKGVEALAVAYGFEMLKAHVSPELIFGALGFSFIIGCVSGLLPARRAAMMNPVNALRYLR